MLLINHSKVMCILSVCWGLVATPVHAKVPQVATDIPPVHSLVSQVMGELGTPKLIIPPGTSPHGYAMRPSEARALQAADVVFWMGQDLTAWFGRAIKALAANATTVALSESKDLIRHPYRTTKNFDTHTHSEGEGDGDATAKIDPHLWLDPDNALIFLDVIATTLARLDAIHADTYLTNAAQAKAALEALKLELNTIVQPIRGRPFIVFHDAYHYFEHRFDVEAAGSVSIGDASSPGPARIAAIRGKVQTLGAICVFSEPQFEPKIIATVIEKTAARSGTLDPVGATLKPGPNQYSQLLRHLAHGLLTCLR
jgi:zinc transport system substrate-binding protein